MLRSLGVALVFALTMTACSQRVYTAKALVPEALTQHKLVAILPFEVRLDRIRMQDITYAGTGTPSETTIEQHRKNWEEKQISQRREVAYQLQQELLNQLVARQAKHPYKVQFQNVTETNNRLERAGITYDNLNDHSMAELQAALGVDAVLSGETSLFQPMPNGVAVALLVLTNGSIPQNEVQTSVTIHDCRSGDLVWKFDHQLVGDLSTNPATLARILVRNSARTFPYRP
ncbi:hypothetical protein E5K00_15645 [Hymenobacter aquaticus]|uniref:DUF3313 domain-containing protein n=1 Tax=Hymenobacter aquaticus TaxID=1867101 RepID=A0A4Z0PW48_9BACT|nr:hypothetical protein [Hymenobacter aquaticus]TGE21705.1 hypothetical protein E5K00_15645 [Hymenobacter aquaticus]